MQDIPLSNKLYKQQAPFSKRAAGRFLQYDFIFAIPDKRQHAISLRADTHTPPLRYPYGYLSKERFVLNDLGFQYKNEFDA